MFKRSGKRSTRLWRQDGDPSQNSKTAREAMGHCNSELLKILPRSPDLNPVEKTFNIVSKKLEKDALEGGITRESCEEFCDRVQGTEWSYCRDNTKQWRKTKVLNYSLCRPLAPYMFKWYLYVLFKVYNVFHMVYGCIATISNDFGRFRQPLK